MSLKSYHQKRKFSRTPEPKGEHLQTNGPLTFVVQKHEASRLHYDFRLELDGVLKSWAVPKGPSTDPEEKRLAMMVEDHPLDYANFEGIIPKGNYGAGTVMVWDSGVYSPLDTVERQYAEKILKKQLESGHITFVLLGKKLKGEYALVKIQNADEKNAWLLVKKNDEYASKNDILKEDESALTARSLIQIKTLSEKKNLVWRSKPDNLDLGEAPQGALPHNIRPMLAHQVSKPFDRKNWLFELKWDGYRAISEIEHGKVSLYSRNNQPFNKKFAPVAESLAGFPHNAVLDGEVVTLNDKGLPDFQLLQDYPKSGGELMYYVFDILYLDGYDLKNLPLIRRKEILKKILPPLPNILYCDHIDDRGTDFFKQADKLGLEGIMAKNKDGIYKVGLRTREWLKIKTGQHQDAVIAGFTQPRGSRGYFGALILGVHEKGQLRYIGHIGGGFNDKSLKSIYDKLKPLQQETCPFEAVPDTNSPVTWVKPAIQCRVAYASWTKDRVMRHPVFVDLIETNPPKISGEQRVFSKQAPGNENEISLQVGQRSLTVTNPNKIFWPDDKYTKGDLINYYKQIAPIILPYLKNRPQSLLRFPNGINGESFFQKDASNLKTGWLMRGRVHSGHNKAGIEYLLCQDEASLIYMINLGCIDLNPWNSTLKHLDRPDYLVIDLDPEGVSFKEVVKVALTSRDVLESLNIESYPKTSGATGIHIYIPMGAKYDYDQVRTFAQLLCTQIHAKIPELTSMVRSPKERQGKVYLDYLQNARGQTLASVYSVRPRSGATISTPLKWSEVTEKLHPSLFTMENIPNRIDKVGDLFKEVLINGIKIEKVISKMDNPF